MWYLHLNLEERLYKVVKPGYSQHIKYVREKE